MIQQAFVLLFKSEIHVKLDYRVLTETTPFLLYIYTPIHTHKETCNKLIYIYDKLLSDILKIYCFIIVSTVHIS